MRGGLGPLGTLGVALTALSALLFLPGRRAPGARPLCAVLIDLSPSMTRLRPGLAATLALGLEEERARAAADGEDLLVIGYAADARRLFGPARPETLDLADALRRAADLGSETRLDRALDLAAAAAKGRPTARLAVWTDATWTGADPSPGLAAWNRERGPVMFELPPPEAADVSLERIELPARPVAGEPLVAAVHVAVAPGKHGARQHVRLEFAVESARSHATSQHTVELPPGGGRTVARVELGPAADGWTRVSTRARNADPVPENDALEAATRTNDAPRVALVVPDPESAAAVAWADALGGRAVQIVVPEELPQRLLEGLDVVVTRDLGTDEPRLQGLLPFVEAGGGWLAAVGWESLDRAPEALPLDFAPADARGRDVVLFADGSGSMAGEPWLELLRAALSFAAGAPAPDRVVFTVFTDRVDARTVLREPGGPPAGEAARELASRRAPGGPTDLVAALDELAAERASSGRDALVLLLSDGRDESGRVLDAAEAARLRDALAAGGARLVPIAVGPDADRALLGRLVPPGEELRLAHAVGDLTELLAREARAGRVAPGPVALAVGAPGADEPVAASVARALQATGPLPALGRLARARPRPGAAVVLRSADGEPALGWWSRGRGAVAAFAADLDADWAGGWADPERWAPIVRGLAAGRPPAVRLERRGDRLVLTDADVAEPGGAESGGTEPGATWPPVVEIELERVDGPGRIQMALGVPEVTAGPDPRARRQGPWPRELDVGGLWRLRIEVPDGASELLWAPPGGGEHRAAALVAPGRGPKWVLASAQGRGPHPAARWVLLAGLLALALAGWNHWGRARSHRQDVPGRGR